MHWRYKRYTHATNTQEYNNYDHEAYVYTITLITTKQFTSLFRVHAYNLLGFHTPYTSTSLMSKVVRYSTSLNTITLSSIDALVCMVIVMVELI